MYSEKSLLMDDASADVLIEYAALLAANGSSDTVRLQAVGEDGNDVEVAFLLNAATVLIVESASADLHPNANEQTVREMRDKIELLRNPPPARMQRASEIPDYDFDDIR